MGGAFWAFHLRTKTLFGLHVLGEYRCSCFTMAGYMQGTGEQPLEKGTWKRVQRRAGL